VPSLQLLTVDRAELSRLQALAKAGDTDADSALSGWWDDVDMVACFLCDAAVPPPINSLILPDIENPKLALIAPVCLDCYALPTLLRTGRALRMLKALYRARTGKRALGFHFTHKRQ
jgi:hypothetical protein